MRLYFVRTTIAVALLAGLSGVATASEPGHLHAAPSATFDDRAAFDLLKRLAGSWTGTGDAVGRPGMPFQVDFRVSSAGHVVFATLFPNTPGEMVEMFRLEGDKLLMTHLCIDGTRPTMRLAPGATPADLVFEFARADNFDPAIAAHIHATRLRLLAGGHLEGEWTTFKNGRELGRMWSKVSRAGS